MKCPIKLRPIAIVWLLLGSGSLFAQATTPSTEQLARWLKRFPEADANGDGRLTAEEADAYRKAAQAMRGKSGTSGFRSARELRFDPGWDAEEFPAHSVSRKPRTEIMRIYKRGPVARAAPADPGAISFPKPTDGGMRIVGVGHSFMAPAYKTLPLICEAAGIEQPLCLHTGGGVTGSARYKWEQENGIFQFDRKPLPKLLAAIANANWEAMLWGGYYNDRPEFYTCWIEFCTRHHPDMKFYLSDTWPQLYQIEELFGMTANPKSESFFTHEVLDRLAKDKRDQFASIVVAARKKTTDNVFIVPTADAMTQAAKLCVDGKLPGVESVHSVVGGKPRAIWRDQTGHLGPGFDRLEGYVFYATLYGQSPEHIKTPINFSDDVGYPGDDLDKIFRRIAWEAVVNHPLSGVKDNNRNGVADHRQ